MQKTQPNTSGESIQDLRQRVLQGLPCRAAVLVDLIDALSVGPRPATPSEVGLSPLWGYANSTLYSGLGEGATPATVAALREARLTWWEQWGDELREGAAGVGRWRVKVLAATNYDRPKTRTVPLSYVHGIHGMRPGHALSVLSEQVGPGSWYLPLEIGLIPVGQAPTQFGATQVEPMSSAGAGSPTRFWRWMRPTRMRPPCVPWSLRA